MDLHKLGLKSGATRKEIKTAFRTLSKKSHPDVVGGNTVDQAALNIAHGRLNQHLVTNGGLEFRRLTSTRGQYFRYDECLF